MVYMRVILNIYSFQVVFRLPNVQSGKTINDLGDEFDAVRRTLLNRGWTNIEHWSNWDNGVEYISIFLFKAGEKDLLFDGADRLFWCHEIMWACRAMWHFAKTEGLYFEKNDPRRLEWPV